MLTSFQCDVVAYVGDGDVYCPECAEKRARADGATDEDLDANVETMFIRFHGIIDPEVTDLSPIIRYTAEDEWPEGLSCGDCGGEIIEPAEDYCPEHEGWRVDGEAYCETARDDGTDLTECSFSDVDPNPPRVRWVPCGVCGARDGERCDTERHHAAEEHREVDPDALDNVDNDAWEAYHFAGGPVPPGGES